jgi:hypothetical protein
MEPGTIAVYIDFVLSKKLIPVETVLDWRILDRIWCMIIESNYDVKNILSIQSKLRRYLWRDPDIYDNNSYKISMIRDDINSILYEYQNIQVPTVAWCYDDMADDSNTKIYFISTKLVPVEYLMFIHEYSLSPSIQIKPYTPESVAGFTKEQISFLRGFEFNNFLDTKVILLTPLVYSKHYRVNLKDKQYITVLCYVNLIDQLLESEFPDERYITITVELKDLDDKDEHHKKLIKEILKITQSIMEPEQKMSYFIYPQNVAEKCESFDKSLEEIFSQQRFNL